MPGNKKLSEAFSLLYIAEAKNFSLVSMNKTVKINELAKDESYYYLDALIDDINDSVFQISKALITLKSDKQMEKILRLNL